MFTQQNRKVLLIDKAPENPIFLKAILVSAGYQVFVYPYAEEHESDQKLATVIKKWQPGILLWDADASNIDARHLLTTLKSNPDSKHLPILIIDQLADQQTCLERIEWGADGFISKPVKAVNLLSSIENLIQIERCNTCIEHRQVQSGQIDFLTNLPNRYSFQETLKIRCRSHALVKPFYLVIFDIDNFKRVNDALGHSVGDILIRYISQRIVGSLDRFEAVAHLGAGTFALVFDGAEIEVRLILKALNAILATPFVISDKEVFLTYSQGLAHFPVDGEDWETLLKHAEIALYEAKQQGRATHRFFDPRMDAKVLRQFQLFGDLRNALARGEFFLLYQPQVAAPDGKIVGMEALIRWQHPVLGLLSPMEFIPLAEESDIICDIGDWVLETACHATHRWKTLGLLEQAVVAVNVSARQFKDGSIFNSVKKALRNSGLAAEFLELELTEGLLMEQPDVSANTLKKLRKLGIKVSIDDFGTGYSSLSYLKTFPIDQIKIDREFINNITTNSDDSAIALTIIGMARQLKREVIAEGVETAEQFHYLYRNHCYKYQGYFFSKPLSESEITAGLVDHFPCVPELHYKVNGVQTLLLVDDNIDQITALKKLFSKTPYHFLIANSAHEGFAQLAREEVHIVLCEQNLPDLKITEFLHRVKDLYPATLGIVFGDRSDLDNIVPALNDGTIYRFLLKPWKDNELLRNIESAIHYLMLEKENRKLIKTIGSNSVG